MKSKKLKAFSASLPLIMGQVWADSTWAEADTMSGTIQREVVQSTVASKVTTEDSKLPAVKKKPTLQSESGNTLSTTDDSIENDTYKTTKTGSIRPKEGVLTESQSTAKTGTLVENRKLDTPTYPPIVVEKILASQKIVETEQQANTVVPVYIRKIDTGETGFNHSNPTWTNDGSMLGFERHDERSKEILITRPDGSIVKTVKYQSEEEDDLGLGALLPDFAESVSYNAGLSWSPDNSRFIFMSNGSEANYDLYMGSMIEDNLMRLTDHSEKDGHANWAPSGSNIAFISGRGGNADIYLLDTMTKQLTQISKSKQPFLYPTWSPDGSRLAVIHGSNENHNIFIYENVPLQSKQRKLIGWEYDDLRPMWSPDGNYIAFYTNYNDMNDPKVWSLAVVKANSKALNSIDEIAPHIVATNIIPDVDKGPSWMPDSKHLVFVENNRKKYNPIKIVNAFSQVEYEVKTDTRINHDVSCSKQGVIAFRSQVDQWDHIFVAKIPDLASLTHNTANN